jgi:hypothetical protein
VLRQKPLRNTPRPLNQKGNLKPAPCAPIKLFETGYSN